ncbi:hypothetical protein PHMEG_00011157 [Phytophthora megakarya]|uniref:Uncharacterized protein n=1 Tax=Phytophthora megakarya TaxID=4795 RepID=A0A225WBW9_9STRA|nr:hypothetical protein PHMEG_00011157 [Phytophthora megakarya]
MMIRSLAGCKEARVINLQVVPMSCLMENLWTPGETMTIPEATKILEAGVEPMDVPMNEPEEVSDDQDSNYDGLLESISVDDGFSKSYLGKHSKSGTGGRCLFGLAAVSEGLYTGSTA